MIDVNSVANKRSILIHVSGLSGGCELHIREVQETIPRVFGESHKQANNEGMYLDFRVTISTMGATMYPSMSSSNATR